MEKKKWTIQNCGTQKYIKKIDKKQITYTKFRNAALRMTKPQAKMVLKRVSLANPGELYWPEEYTNAQTNWLAVIAILCSYFCIVMLLVYTLFFLNKKNNCVDVAESYEDLPVASELISLAKETQHEEELLQKSIDYCKYRYADVLAETIMREAKENGLPVYVCYALFTTESELKLSPKNKKGLPYYGIGQVGQEVLDDYNLKHGTKHKIADLETIEVGVKVALWFFKWCYDYTYNFLAEQGRDDWCWEDCYAAYNCGPGNFKKHWQDIHFRSQYKGEAYAPKKRFADHLVKAFEEIGY